MTSNFDEIIKALREGLKKSPDSLTIRKHLASLLLQAGKFQEAEAELRQTLDQAPEDQSLKLQLAEAYAGQQKRDVALFILEELMQGTQPPTEAFRMAEELYLQAGDIEKAAETHKQAGQDKEAKPAGREKTGKGKQAKDGQELPRVPVLAAPEHEDNPGEVEKPKVTFKEVGGMDKLKDEIRLKIIYPLVKPEIYKAYGKDVGGGILMYGPPGCGKTHIARATAGEVKARFLAVGIHDILNMYLGESESNLHNTFELARANTPCVLFFDEVDALGASRSDMRHNAGRHVINQLLAEMDGLNASNKGVLILAATNAPWHMDAALRRPGRFDRVLFVPPPDAEARAAILRIQLEGKPTEKLDYARLGNETEGFSGADLKGMVELAVERKLSLALTQGAVLALSTRDLLEARKQIKPSTREWFATARNYALYANQSRLYDEVIAYIEKIEGKGFFQKRVF